MDDALWGWFFGDTMKINMQVALLAMALAVMGCTESGGTSSNTDGMSGTMAIPRGGSPIQTNPDAGDIKPADAELPTSGGTPVVDAAPPPTPDGTTNSVDMMVPQSPDAGSQTVDASLMTDATVDMDTGCIPQARRRCVDGEPHWFDSCGRLGELIEMCADGLICKDGECACDPAAPGPTNCEGTDVVQRDGCGMVLNIVEACGPAQVCVDGQCLIPNCQPADEMCDGLDNDCDGNLDEAAPCPSHGQRPHATGAATCPSLHWLRSTRHAMRNPLMAP